MKYIRLMIAHLFFLNGCSSLEFPEYDQGKRFWEPRSTEHEVKYIICHCTGMSDLKEVVAVFKDYGVSAHFVISPEGEVTQLVDVKNVAYHTGPSYFEKLEGTPLNREGNPRLNYTSIGIEFISPGYGKRGSDWYHFTPFTSIQTEVGIKLISKLMSEFNIRPYNVIGHSDISPFTKSNTGEVIFGKSDPGAKFFWKELSDHNIGMPVPPKDAILEPQSILWVQESLRNIGYCTTPMSGVLDLETVYVLLAFQQHFVQHKFDDPLYAKTCIDTRDSKLLLDKYTYGSLNFLREYKK